ncbi:MAG: hypothetical protein VX641_07085 [Planctomycetota bacterium]|nr:hypothetical protein [Planctomycetota bacterium]
MIRRIQRRILGASIASLSAVCLMAAGLNSMGPDWDGDCGNNQDAGNKPSTAVSVSYGFSVETRTIKGCLKGPASSGGLAGETPGDYQDMFKVVIRFPGEFQISTTGPNGTTEFDSLLCVFDFQGRPLLANITGEQGQLGSTVGNQSTDGFFRIDRPGAIYISISGADSRPVDGNGTPLFAFTSNRTDVVGPRQAEGGPIADWDQPGQYGDYIIALTGVGPIPPGCGAENTSSCTVVHALPFCDVPECCESVCAVDPHCCEITWDEPCVGTAQLVCNQGQAGCGRKGIGPCNEAHSNPFCDDPICCARVCLQRPFCCEVGWDPGCAELAGQICTPPCNDECRTDLNGDGVTGAQDLTVLLGSWGRGGCPDLNNSGTVDGADLAALLAAWNTSCGS